ncbi:MAG: hypothetical protein R3243_16430 [Arenibacter latericius]|nr:hypothetical protein [Arenibacter latericius]
MDLRIVISKGYTSSLKGTVKERVLIYGPAPTWQDPLDMYQIIPA